MGIHGCGRRYAADLRRALGVYRQGARWGYNGKRGDVNNPSHDVVTYHHGPGPDYGSTAVYIIDVIAGHCGATPSATWIDVTDATYNGGTIGRWISRGRF